MALQLYSRRSHLLFFLHSFRVHTHHTGPQQLGLLPLGRVEKELAAKHGAKAYGAACGEAEQVDRTDGSEQPQQPQQPQQSPENSAQRSMHVASMRAPLRAHQAAKGLARAASPRRRDAATAAALASALRRAAAPCWPPPRVVLTAPCRLLARSRDASGCRSRSRIASGSPLAASSASPSDC